MRSLVRFQLAPRVRSNCDARRNDHRRGGRDLPEPVVKAVHAIRRAVLALGVAGIIAAAIRLRGSGGVPPQSGGWRELSGPELR